MKRIVAADLFCGAGGTSTGLLTAAERFGYRLDLLAVNHWDIAIGTHAANHPDVRHLCESLDGVDPRKVIPGRLDILVASPECFPAGTLILTTDGLRPIEEIQVGDRVLTHRGRWCPVMHTMRRQGDTVRVRGQGHYGLETTADHPFFARRRFQKWENAKRRYRWEHLAPEWMKASNLADSLWATPINFPTLPVPEVPGRGAVLDQDFWWLVGRWLADGSLRIRETNSEITIACGKHRADELEKRLVRQAPTGPRVSRGEFRWRRRDVRTAVLFETAHQGLAAWIEEHFGRLAHGKTIPAWVLSLPSDDRRALLEGYLSGDGSEDHRRTDASTVSKKLAIGVRLLAESLGYRVCMSYAQPRGGAEIEGRPINERPQYRLFWSKTPKKRKIGIRDGSHSWLPVSKIEPTQKGVEVFNLSVADDESYVADGIVVHNCTHHSRARGGRPLSDQLRASAWHVVRWAEALRPRWILVENVQEFRSWGPLGHDGRPLKSRAGETFASFLQALRSLNYTVEHRVLNAAHYGDPTSRERLFVLARRGRGRIHWPEATHGPEAGDLFTQRRPWRTAREIIDWSIPGASIFDRKRPLAPATLRRIEAGLKKFGGTAAEPFLVILRNNMTARSLDLPAPTVSAGGGHFGLVQPFIVPQFSTLGPRSIDKPLNTITTQSRGIGLVEPFLVPFFGERDGQKPRTHSIDRPLPAVTGQGAGALIEPFLVPYYGTGGPRPVSQPLGTLTTKARFGLCETDYPDIRFRMLQPHELAAAMGFPPGYQFTGTKSDQVRQIGNAVPVGLATALAGAMLREAA